MNAQQIEIGESGIVRDYRGCVTATSLYLKFPDAWLELDSWDHRSKGFDSLVPLRAWDYYGDEGSSCNVFDDRDHHIGAAWVEAMLAEHKDKELYVLIYLGFRTDIPWVKCPKFLREVYAVKVSDFSDYSVPEIVDSFAERLWENCVATYERDLTTD